MRKNYDEEIKNHVDSAISVIQKIYDDYEKVNKYITEKYNVDLPKHLYKYGNYKKGKPEYLTYDFLDNFINEVIDKKIEDRIKELKGEYYEYKN